MNGDELGRGRRRTRRLTTGEAELWRRVLETVRPLRGGRGSRAKAGGLRDAAPEGIQPSGGAPEESSAAASTSASRGTRERSAKATVRPARASASEPAPKSPPGLGGLDRKTRRGLARGSVRVDARLDLHGMTQEAAHRELRHFLTHAHGRGLRHVLIITGKGRRPNDLGEAGVLRRAVPEWLRQPELRHYVSSIGPASAAHGGDGALYVRLARPGQLRRRP